MVVDEQQTEVAAAARWPEVLAGEQRAAVVPYGAFCWDQRRHKDDVVVMHHRVADGEPETVGGAALAPELQNEAAIPGRDGVGVVQDPAVAA